MIRKANPRLIGAFLAGALGLLILAIGVLGSGTLFRQSRTFVIYFDSSVSGLDISAPVNFRGVRVGTVSDVVLMVDPKTFDIFIKVLVNIEQDRIQRSIPDITGASATGIYRILLDRGMRAQLKTESLVTGKQYVGLDLFPDIPSIFHDFESDFLEIPAVPTSTEQLQRSLTEMVENLKGVDIKQVFENVENVLARLDELLSSGDLHESVAKLNVALGEINQLSRNLGDSFGDINESLLETLDGIQVLVMNLNDQVTTLSAGMNALATDARRAVHSADTALQFKEGATGQIAANIIQTSTQARQTLESLDQTLLALRGAVEADSPTMYELDQALRELTPTLRAIRHLTEMLEQNPQAILYGKSAND